ncbi:MAG: hypothetical protein ABI972_12185 [Acidobacteriota bacterium]
MTHPHRVEVLKYTPEEILIRQRPGYVEFAVSTILAGLLLGYTAYESVLPDTNLALCGLLAAVAFLCSAVAAFSLLESRFHAQRNTGTLILQRRFLTLGSTRRIQLEKIREVRMEPALFHRAGLSAVLRSGRLISLTFPPVPGDRFWLDKLALDLSSFVPRAAAVPPRPRAG